MVLEVGIANTWHSLPAQQEGSTKPLDVRLTVSAVSTYLHEPNVPSFSFWHGMKNGSCMQSAMFDKPLPNNTAKQSTGQSCNNGNPINKHTSSANRGSAKQRCCTTRAANLASNSHSMARSNYARGRMHTLLRSSKIQLLCSSLVFNLQRGSTGIRQAPPTMGEEVRTAQPAIPAKTAAPTTNAVAQPQVRIIGNSYSCRSHPTYHPGQHS